MRLACALVAGLVGALVFGPGSPSAKVAKSGESSQTFMLCATGTAGSNYVVRNEPRKCIETNDVGGYLNLTHLRWRHWGNAVARAKGKQQHGATPPFPIRVKVDRLVRCDDGPEPTWSYTRIKGILEGYSFHLDVPANCD